MNLLFPPELRTSSIVHRWSIVRTIQTDNVANHSFYVTAYAVAIAQLLAWIGPLADLMFMALMHDAREETITGDIVSPVKERILDRDRRDDYINEKMIERMPMIEAQAQDIMTSDYWPDIESLIKVADRLDAVLFLVIEQRMGNVVLEPMYTKALAALREAWDNLSGGSLTNSDWGVSKDDFNKLWDDQVWPAIQAHWRHGGIGV